MTVDAIRLQNFMAFEDTDWINLRPITLLFGRNSSGKSVLIRALRLLYQSVQYARDGDIFVFSSPYGVDIGDFREIIHNRKFDATVRFHFRCTSGEIKDILSNVGFPDMKDWVMPILQITLGYSFSIESEEKRTIGLSEMEIQIINSENQSYDLLFHAILLEGEDASRYGEDWYVDGLLTSMDENAVWAGFACRVERGFLDVKFIPPENNDIHGYKVLERLFAELRREIRYFLEQIIYLGPLRPEPQRRYSFSQSDITEWKARGWSAFLDFIGGRMSTDKIQKINEWLQRLELAQGTEPRLTSEQGSLYTEFELAIREREQVEPVPLSAMGFGLAQVLPIVVQCVAAQPGSLIIIEQPELHLHPRAQAALGDLFITMGYEGVRFLIETHSEHLLLRLRRRIAEEGASRKNDSTEQSERALPLIRKEDLDVRFIYRQESISKIVCIGVDDHGELDTSNAPQQFNDFFADDLIELAALVRASL